MNTRMKRRMIAGTGVIVMVLIVVLAIVGGNSAAKSVTVAEALEPSIGDKKIQVSGSVVDNSYEIEGNNLSFDIYDNENDPNAETRLRVRYDGGVSATFGNGVTAICTGKISSDGVLVCSELVTKCPSKYESVTDALTISGLLEYGDSVIDKPVKVAGTVKDGTIAAVDSADRFVVVDPETSKELRVRYNGALSDEITDGSSLVLTGSISKDGTFAATNVALEA